MVLYEKHTREQIVVSDPAPLTTTQAIMLGLLARAHRNLDQAGGSCRAQARLRRIVTRKVHHAR